MKKSSSITLTFLATTVFLTGCSKNYEVKRCVDKDGFAVSEQNCELEDRRPFAPAGSYGYVPRGYWWNYGGTGGYNYGDRIFGGRSTPTEGLDAISPARASSMTGSRGGGGFVTRGGFGGHFSSAS